MTFFIAAFLSLACVACSRSARSRHPRTVFLLICLLAIGNAMAETKPTWGQAGVDGLVEGLLLPFKKGKEGLKNISKSAEKQIFGKQETETGEIRKC